MDSLRKYLLSLIAAAVIVSIVMAVVNKKQVNGAIIKLLCGLFLTFTLLSPLVKVQILELQDFYTGIFANGDVIVAYGKKMAQQSTGEIIKADLEAYILDKASKLQLDVEVCLVLSDALYPVPETVTITGEISPYSKKVMQEFLSDEIGIPEEKQIWQ